MNTSKSKEISRRDFITILWGAVAALPFLYGAFSFLNLPDKKFKTTIQKNKSQNSGLTEIDINTIPEDSAKLINIDDEPVLLIRKKANDITALSAECTHLNCIVGYRKESSDIYCSCHGGRFGLDGNVLEGPPKKPLKKYSVSLNGNKALIKLPA